jgi:hypothetical protein
MQYRVEARYTSENVKRPVIIKSIEDVDGLIDALLTGPQYENLAQLHSLQRSLLPSGDFDHELLVGANGDLGLGVLAFMDSNGNVVTRGPSDGRAEPIYWMIEHRREFPDFSEVPIHLVRQAVKEFLLSGGLRPSCVEWQEPEIW